MPRASRPCVSCPALIPPGVTGARCPTCRKKRTRTTNANRRARGDHWYDSPAWRRTRTDILTRHPTCQYCDNAKSEHADHVPPRRILLAAGIHQPDHPRWLIAACARCHNTATARIDSKLAQQLANGTPATHLAEQAINLRTELTAELRRVG